MSLSNKLFRKAALERLASPERLDQLIKITSPVGWLTLGAIIFLILVTIVWGFLGKIPTTVQANGILTRTGGLYSIQSPSNGIILSINVNQGDIVKAGEVVARLSQVDVLNQISCLFLRNVRSPLSKNPWIEALKLSSGSLTACKKASAL